MCVSKEDDDVIYVKGHVEGVKVCVDLEDAAGYIRAEQSRA